MELFRDDGCFSEEGLHALLSGQLDEMGRLEAAEHLAYCDRCMDRYTALLTADALETPPRSARSAVMTTIWVRLMQSTLGRGAVAAVAAVLALTMWRSGSLVQLTQHRQLTTWLPSASQSQTEETDRRLGKPVEDDDRPVKENENLGKPVEDTPHRKDKLTMADAVNGLLFGSDARRLP